jgi:hypothetical protein
MAKELLGEPAAAARAEDNETTFGADAKERRRSRCTEFLQGMSRRPPVVKESHLQAVRRTR